MKFTLNVILLILFFFGTVCSKDADCILPGYSVDTLHHEYKNGSLSFEEVVKACLERIDKIDRRGPALNAKICINPDALSIARTLYDKIRAGKMRGPLTIAYAYEQVSRHFRTQEFLEH